NEAERRDVFAIRIPRLLSLLAYNRLEGEVKGINDLNREYQELYGPGDYVPPIAITYWTFRIMVGAGMLMALLALYALYLVLKSRFTNAPRFLKWLPYAIGLPYLANTAGWLMTELGRQPWIVQGLQLTEEAISPNVSAGSVLFSLIAFTLLYGVLMAADIFLLAKYAKAGIEAAPAPAPEEIVEVAPI
ncbi:MAG TPA: cytochrome ubiquinol oxidase subunit I, partial [Aggregatilineales bacterium]|nr:cytochrome ubiquinol oxidase subunit I [Aggregatilineales bacterium]